MHSSHMHWSQLIDTLVRNAGGALAVAKAMKAPTFQGTLHKIASGNVTAPSRKSAERIASFFGIPVDALYDDNVATRVHEELFGPGSAPDERRVIHAEQPRSVYGSILSVDVEDDSSSLSLAQPQASYKPDSIIKVLEKLGAIMAGVDPLTRYAISPLVMRIIDIPDQASILARKVNALINADIDFERQFGKSTTSPETSRKMG